MESGQGDPCAKAAPKLLTVEQARQQIIDTLEPVQGSVTLSLRRALNNVLAEPVQALVDVPPFDNSAMDGYAVMSEDCDGAGEHTLEVIGTSWAGKPFDGTVLKGQCVRIMTGAAMPAGADAVIMQEQVQRDGEQIRFGGIDVSPGLNTRCAGEDSRRGQTVLQAGHRLGPAELGLLASVGVPEVNVVRPLQAAFFSTGDELRSVGSQLENGQIYDSNRYSLFGLLNLAGIEVHDLGVVADTREAVRNAFLQASSMADIIVTSGGVSVGEADFVTDTLRELGEVGFWRIAMKPGKPLAFGRIGQSVFFGLPGNPVSVMVTFLQFVWPAIRKMKGEAQQHPLLFQARCKGGLGKTPGRMEYQRGILEADGKGGWLVSTTGQQDSHVLSSMVRSNCFILLDRESSGAADGEMVTVQAFQGLF